MTVTEVPEAVVHSAQGEDRSGYQAVVSWRGNQFGYTKATEGTGFVDVTFAPNWANMESEVQVRGAYHFYHPAYSAIDQAHFFWDVVSARGLRDGDFLVADIEIMVGADGSWVLVPGARYRSHQPAVAVSGTPPAHAGVLTNGARGFLDTLSALAGPHHPVLVYTDLSVGAQLTSCTGYDLIIAYPSSSAPGSVWPWDSWLMWQYAAGGGIGGGDRDAFNGPDAGLLAWNAKYLPKPPPPPSHSRVPSMSGDDMFYIPNGAGAVVTVPVPAAVVQADGTFRAPTVLRLCTNAAAQVETQQGPSAAWSAPFAIDFQRGPNPVTLDAPLPAEVKVRRVDSGTNYVTADFA